MNVGQSAQPTVLPSTAVNSGPPHEDCLESESRGKKIKTSAR